MFKIDDAFLADLGLASLPQAEKEAMKHHIYETLEMRVGMKLAQQMTNEQLDEFEAFINRNDEPGALRWLETNFPNYKQVVADELEALRQEVKTTAPQILAASSAAQQMPGMPAAASAQPPAQPYQPVPPNPPAAPQMPPQPPMPPQPTPPMPPQPPMPSYPPAPDPSVQPMPPVPPVPPTPQYPPQQTPPTP